MWHTQCCPVLSRVSTAPMRRSCAWSLLATSRQTPPPLLSLKVLSKYRSGKLPKAFKIIPALSNWEQILYITEPETWTAAAMYQATRWTSTVHSELSFSLSVME